MSFALLDNVNLLQEIILSETVLEFHFLGFSYLLSDKAF